MAYVLGGFWDEQRCAKARAEGTGTLANFRMHFILQQADQRVFGANNVSCLIDDLLISYGITALVPEPRLLSVAILGNHGSGVSTHLCVNLKRFCTYLMLDRNTVC